MTASQEFDYEEIHLHKELPTAIHLLSSYASSVTHASHISLGLTY